MYHMANTKMKLKKLIKKINKENAPPGGWNSSDKLQAASLKLQARKASSSKPQALKRKLQASSRKLQAQ